MVHISTGPLSALKHRNFAWYLTAQLLTSFAVQVQSVALGWQIYRQTGSLVNLGLIGLVQFVPFLLLILPAGLVADRYNRRTIILWCTATQVLCALLLMLLAGGTTRSGIWPVFAVLILFASARAFLEPARQAMLTHVVPRGALSTALPLTSSASELMVILGPVAGGALALAGPATAYLACTLLLSGAMAAMLMTRAPPAIISNSPGNWRTVFDGVRFIWSKPIMLGVISLDLFAVLFGGATALLPALAHDVFHVGPAGLGLLRAAPAAGAVLCALVLVLCPVRRRVGYVMFAGVALFGAGTVALGAATGLWLALAALVVIGVGDELSVYVRQTMVQLGTPDALRGRVGAVHSIFVGTSNQLGAFESGLAAHWLGLSRAIVAGGVATVLITFTWMRTFPALARLDRFPDADGDADAAPAHPVSTIAAS